MTPVRRGRLSPACIGRRNYGNIAPTAFFLKNPLIMHLGHTNEPEEENPELALRHFGRAIEFIRAGEKSRAIEELRRVLEYEPGFSEARAKLAQLIETKDEDR